jgi:diguanylate cyclase (GGDEF)-like protein
MRIIIVDNDKLFCELLKSILIEQNHVIDIASDAETAWDYIEYGHYDLIILDVMLPSTNGINFCRKLRAKGLQAPVMLVTPRDNSSDKILGLDAGADDYVVKSIPLSELEARIRALLRRKIIIQTPLLVWGDLQLNPNRCEVKYGKFSLNLTAKEYRLLELFMQNTQQIHSHGTILKQLWSLEDELPSSETVRALVKRLRQKLKIVGAANLIETVYGLGYRLNPVFQKSLPSETKPPDQNQEAQNFLQLSDTLKISDIQISKKPEAKVILVDDDKLTTRLVETILEPWGLQVTVFNDSQQVLDQLDVVAPDLLILDVQMPITDGIELCQLIRNNSKWSWIPIIFLTIHRDAETLQNVFAAGGDDYVSKPVVAPELVTRIFNRLERTRLMREQIETDALTGLPNRRRSGQDIKKFIELSSKSQQPFCLAVVALSQLNQINRDYGHTIGEQILRKLAQILRQELREEDIISLWNGAEFIIGMYNITRDESTELILKAITLLQQIEFTVSENLSIHAIVNTGIAQYPDDGEDIQSLYKQAALRL